jgi:integrase
MRPGLRVLVEALVAGKEPSDRLFAFVDFPRKAWARGTKAAGCPDLLFHDLRRTSARSKRAAGVDTSVTMALMGWRSEAMFRRYGIVATEDKMAALEKQEAYENGYKTVTVPPSTSSLPS